MKIPYCLPIIKKSKQEVLEMIEKYKNDYSYLEVWLDYVQDRDVEFVQKLTEQLGEKLIILFRRQNLETIHTDLQKRVEIIKILENTTSYLDLDCIAQTDELNTLSHLNGKLNLIASYHNYRETPKNEKLLEIIETMQIYHPTVFKLATFCNTQDDAIRLLQILLKLKEKKVQYIVLGMGKHGAITRIFGTLWGNMMIFAPFEAKHESAPNQLTKLQLEKIFSELSNFSEE